jgi:RES domain-containing protein
MLATRALPGALKRIRGRSYQGTLCRAVHAATLYGFEQAAPYRPRPLYSLGPSATGARFTPRGGSPALDLAEDHTTALHEYLQVGSSARLAPAAGTEALVLFTVDVRLTSVLDLTRVEVQAMLGTSARELGSPWRYRQARGVPPTHALGRAVARSGRFDAIRFASTKGPGSCLAIFTSLLAPPAQVRIRDPRNRLLEELP